jgi:pyrroloquinoline-quinone synthase
MEFFDNLDRAIETHEACHNEFFVMLSCPQWSHARLAAFSHEYYYWIRSFPGILASLVANVNDEESRFFLVEILHSELGSGHSERAHHKLFKQLVLSLGVAEEEIHSRCYWAETEALVTGMLTLYGDSCICRALGAQYALEKQALPMIQNLDRGLRCLQHVKDSPFDYFDLHMMEEPEHLRCMQECVTRHLGHAEDRDEVSRGAFDCLSLIATFWRRQAMEFVALKEN